MAMPKFFTTDVKDKCSIYELCDCIDDGYITTAIYKEKKRIYISTSEQIVEDTSASTAGAIIIEVQNKNPIIPQTYNQFELVWYEDVDDIDEVLTMCVI